MDSSEESSCASEHSEVYSSETDESICKGCYDNEPEYTESQLKNICSSKTANDISDDEDEDLDSSRLENLHWCKCKKCDIHELMTVKECKCCLEFTTLLGEKLEENTCITLHKDFNILCLNRTVLETASIRHRRYQNNFKDIKSFQNKQLRFQHTDNIRLGCITMKHWKKDVELLYRHAL
ncbi:uncharacterized protein LOC130613407 [Hydractinia symbiolongicarpus]|uniref:uncharacterized protein LOC130613407 n=1 Tax=Hydractinia symbiolongicarpus TaxID=13093 RepID=UPI0025507248|nr:uncharacterized protein LOC130613407 [Hydractinia symbiolongicarpus]